MSIDAQVLAAPLGRIRQLAGVAAGILLSVALLLGAVRPSSAQAASVCPPVHPSSSEMMLSPGEVELPEGTQATFQATVGPISGIISQPNERVHFQVACGPDAGQQGTAVTAAHLRYEPRRYSALFTIRNHGLIGKDELIATSSVRGHRVRAVIGVQWAARVANCDPQLGFLASFKCAESLARGASATEKCAVGVASFLIPADEFAVLLRAAGTLSAAKIVGRSFKASLEVERVAVDLRAIASADHVSVGQLVQTFRDGRGAAQFLGNVWALVKDSASPQVSQLAYDITKLTGLDSCVTLLSHVLGPPPATYGPVSLGSLCSGSDNVFIDAINGCPYDGGTGVGGAPFGYQVLIENNNDSVTPSYWDLIDFPANTCHSITMNFAIPDGGGSPGDRAGLAVTNSSGQQQTATVAYGQVGTLTASLTGGPWSLENTATSAADMIAVAGTAECSSPSGY